MEIKFNWYTFYNNKVNKNQLKSLDNYTEIQKCIKDVVAFFPVSLDSKINQWLKRLTRCARLTLKL